MLELDEVGDFLSSFIFSAFLIGSDEGEWEGGRLSRCHDFLDSYDCWG